MSNSKRKITCHIRKTRWIFASFQGDRHNGKVKSFEALMKYGIKNDRKNIGADFCKKVPNLNVDQSTYWHPLATVIGNVILGRILRWYEVLDI